MPLSNKYSLSVLIIIACFFVFQTIQIFPFNPISWDNFGYYLYLPAYFIYNDLSLTNLSWVNQIIETYNSTDTLYQLTPIDGGNNVIKYSIGMAILYAPFFFIGHLFSLFSSYPSDGFSLPYVISFIVGSLFYTVVGLIFLRKTLLRLFNDVIAAIVLFVIAFGTNYYHINIYNIGMSHIPLFALYAILIWYSIKWFTQPKLVNSLVLSATLGLMIITRPTEIVAVFIPLLYVYYSLGSLTSFKSFIQKHKQQIFWMFFVVIAIGSIQLIYWKIQTGQFFFYSYNNAGEGLDFLYPHTINTLFSFRKGWFIYTPIMVFAVTGFYWLNKLKKAWFYPTLIFFVFNLYLVSSWSNWWYAASFSQRALVQSYAVMALPLGAIIQRFIKQKSLFIFLGVIFGLLIVLNLFQTWQINNGILSTSRMTKAYYKSTFLQTTSPTDKQKELLLIKRFTTANEVFTNPEDYNQTKTFDLTFEDGNEHKIVHSGKKSFALTKDVPYSPNISVPYSEITKKDHAWLKISMWVFPTENWLNSKLTLVYTFEHEGKAYKWRGLENN